MPMSKEGYLLGKNFARQLVYEKLDRVVFTEDCAQLFPNYLVTNRLYMCPDYAFVLLNTELAHQPKRDTNFKYQHSWAHYQKTHTIVKKNWKIGIRRTSMYRVTQLVKRMQLDRKS